MKLKRTFTICLLLLLSALLPALWAADAPPSPLPPEARVAFDEGMVAVGQQQWTVAIRNFLKAQKIVPEAPEVLFNLGLAESKVPGRELRAMAWFQAYLLASPGAPNSEAVRKEMVNLRIRVEATLEKMVRQAKQMVAQHMNKDTEKDRWVSRIAVTQAKTGDIAGAKQIVVDFLINLSRKYDWDFGGPPAALREIAFVQCLTGDRDGAIETIRAIKPYGKTDEAHVNYYARLASQAHEDVARLQQISVKRISMSRTYASRRGDEDLVNLRIIALPEPTAANIIAFINEDLSASLFTDPQSALQAIDAKPMSVYSGITMQDQMIGGFAKAIGQIADMLHDLRKLGQ